MSSSRKGLFSEFSFSKNQWKISSASLRANRRPSSAPPSCAGPCAASSPTPASGAGSGTSTSGPRCWASSATSTTPPAPHGSSPRPPSPRRAQISPACAPSTPATAASSSAAARPHRRITAASSSGTPSRARSGSCPCTRGTGTRRSAAAAAMWTATAAPSSWASAPAPGTRSPASTHLRLVRGASRRPVPSTSLACCTHDHGGWRAGVSWDGGRAAVLGLSGMEEPRLYLWSLEANTKGDASPVGCTLKHSRQGRDVAPRRCLLGRCVRLCG
uniref:Uncharacterized protein n=1 Tax=Arundo donax TaxID=35708 RepID=A0A0A8XUP7_ARUDO